MWNNRNQSSNESQVTIWHVLLCLERRDKSIPIIFVFQSTIQLWKQGRKNYDWVLTWEYSVFCQASMALIVEYCVFNLKASFFWSWRLKDKKNNTRSLLLARNQKGQKKSEALARCLTLNYKMKDPLNSSKSPVSCKYVTM